MTAWTFVEYTFHRFLLHMEDLLPDNRYFLLFHFLLHAVHHFLPFDHLRLAMPPVLFGSLASATYATLNSALPWARLNPIMCGLMHGFVIYDMMHFYLHHGAEKSRFQFIRVMKRYHALHHYKNPNLGWGVTTKVWDRVFGTELIDSKIL